MNIGTTFTRFKDGQEVRVADIDNNVAILDTGERVAVERLLDRNQYDLIEVGTQKPTVKPTQTKKVVESNTYKQPEQQNPFDLTSSTKSIASILQQQASSLDLENIKDVPSFGASVNMHGNVVENSRANNTNTQNVEPDAESELLQKYNHLTGNSNNKPKKDNGNIKLSKNATLEDLVKEPKQTISTPPPKPIDVAIEFFKGIKRTESLKLSVTLDEKVPSKAFIVAMEENHEKSIIEYLANDIYQGIMKSPNKLKKQIEEALRNYIKEDDTQ